MDEEKIEQTAKVMKWVPGVIAAGFVALALVTLFLNIEDATQKQNILFFGLFGLLALTAFVFGTALSVTLSALTQKDETEEESEEPLP